MIFFCWQDTDRVTDQRKLSGMIAVDTRSVLILSGVEASDPWQMSSANQNNRDLSGIYLPEIIIRNYSVVSLSLTVNINI